MEWIVAGIVGLVTGTVGSLVAPWVQWAVEKKRGITENRREKLVRWRKKLSWHEANGSNIPKMVEYTEMRPFLSAKTKESCEGGSIAVVVGRSGDVIKNMILDDLTRIEEKWGLV